MGTWEERSNQKNHCYFKYGLTFFFAFHLFSQVQLPAGHAVGWTTLTTSEQHLCYILMILLFGVLSLSVHVT